MGGFETGISTIAAPVFNSLGQVAAAISITVPSARIEDNAVDPLADMVCASAQQLSDRLQHLPSRSGWSVPSK